jgi:hypothetical protein
MTTGMLHTSCPKSKSIPMVKQKPHTKGQTATAYQRSNANRIAKGQIAIAIAFINYQ